MHDFPVDVVVLHGIEMRNLQRSNRFDREREDLLCLAGRVPAAQPLSRGAERAQHLRAVESLTLTVVTETHDGLTIVKDYHCCRYLPVAGEQSVPTIFSDAT